MIRLDRKVLASEFNSEFFSAGEEGETPNKNLYLSHCGTPCSTNVAGGTDMLEDHFRHVSNSEKVKLLMALRKIAS